MLIIFWWWAISLMMVWWTMWHCLRNTFMLWSFIECLLIVIIPVFRKVAHCLIAICHFFLLFGLLDYKCRSAISLLQHTCIFRTWTLISAPTQYLTLYFLSSLCDYILLLCSIFNFFSKVFKVKLISFILHFTAQ